MTTREYQQLQQALGHIRDLRRELELSSNMLEACKRNNERLHRRIAELQDDLTAIAKMEGRE